MFHHQQKQISQKGNKPLEKQEQRTHTTAPQVSGMHPATLIQRAKAEPSSLSADEVLTLQSAIGNREVSRLLAGRSTTKVQAKLTIGQPGDKYEQEADRVASQVVEQIHAPASAQPTPGQSVQRQEESEEEIQAKPSISDLQKSPLSPAVQREAMPEEDELQAKSILQRGEAIAVGDASTDLESAINRARGSGQPLDAGLQQSMGQAMGADFSGVRVHTDAQSDQLNQSIQAKAFTTGQDVFFRQGEYNPGSRGGQELIAHELTHVVQQKVGVVQRKSHSILVGDSWSKPFDDALVMQQKKEVTRYLRQWKAPDRVFDGSSVGRRKVAFEKYVTDKLELDIRALLRKYALRKSFDNYDDLSRQLLQDIKLKLLGMERLIGIDHQDGQFSQSPDDAKAGRTGKGRKLRIYRTMPKKDWNSYEKSNDSEDILKGHGASLGQALYYFDKSKADSKDDVLVEFEFSQTAQDIIDYTQIQKGGEGKGTKGNKLTGKSEQNDIIALDQKIFSINLSSSKDLIKQLNPKIRIKDKVR